MQTPVCCRVVEWWSNGGRKSVLYFLWLIVDKKERKTGWSMVEYFVCRVRVRDTYI